MIYAFVGTTRGGPNEEPVAIFVPADYEPPETRLGESREMRCDIATLRDNLAWMRRGSLRRRAERRALKELRRKVRRWKRREAKREALSPAIVYDLTGEGGFYGHVSGAIFEARPGKDVILVPPDRERFARYLAGIHKKEGVEIRPRADDFASAFATLRAL